MILLEYHNRILLEKIQAFLDGEKIDMNFAVADFDGVLFRVSQGTSPNIITVSVKWSVIPELLKHGGAEEMKSIYGNMIVQPEAGFHFAIQFDSEKIPGDKAKFPEAISLLKRHLLAGPFKKIFNEVDSGKTPPGVIVLEYRDQEAIYLKAEQDKVIVIFSINFRDQGDQVLAKIFLQEFASARNANKELNNAPPVTYSTRDAPIELKGVPGVRETDTHSFVSFVLFKAHINPKNREKTINNIETFRDYLHYHIKCSKADMHTRMRARVEKFLQVMNAARPAATEAKEKKTAGGKTFTRK